MAKIVGDQRDTSRTSGARMPMSPRRRQAWRLASRRAATLMPVALLAQAQGAAAQSSPARPSIVLILTDDEDLAAHAHLPKTQALLEEQGTSFANYFATYPLCAPSRATVLRGQYPHNHRIEGNVQPVGGYEKFEALGHGASTVATWLDAAGYHTALVGKYVNGYEADQHPPAPGWDHWFVTQNRFYNYQANRNGAVVAFGSAARDYLTDVLAAEAVGVIRRAAAAGQPFFLHVTPFAPHGPATPAPRHARGDSGVALPRPPSFGEADVGDKPALIQARKPITPERELALEAHHRKRVRSLQAIDDLVERLVRALAETGRLASTYVIYASDNGLHLGEHRIAFQKLTPYEEAIRVPLVVRGPGVPAGRRVERLVVNNDLAPTLAAMAGVAPPSYVDGRSFLPLLTDPDRPWRQAFLIERRTTGRTTGEHHRLTGAAVFDAVRTAGLTYVEYGNGERELYDLGRDPFQLDNRAASADPGLLAALSARLAELRACAAATCRALEDRPIEPASPAAVTAR
jgi:arylsulfatase A-like enzyme